MKLTFSDPRRYLRAVRFMVQKAYQLHSTIVDKLKDVKFIHEFQLQSGKKDMVSEMAAKVLNPTKDMIPLIAKLLKLKLMPGLDVAWVQETLDKFGPQFDIESNFIKVMQGWETLDKLGQPDPESDLTKDRIITDSPDNSDNDDSGLGDGEESSMTRAQSNYSKGTMHSNAPLQGPGAQQGGGEKRGRPVPSNPNDDPFNMLKNAVPLSIAESSVFQKSMMSQSERHQKSLKDDERYAYKNRWTWHKSVRALIVALGILKAYNEPAVSLNDHSLLTRLLHNLVRRSEPRKKEFEYIAELRKQFLQAQSNPKMEQILSFFGYLRFEGNASMITEDDIYGEMNRARGYDKWGKLQEDQDATKQSFVTQPTNFRSQHAADFASNQETIPRFGQTSPNPSPDLSLAKKISSDSQLSKVAPSHPQNDFSQHNKPSPTSNILIENRRIEEPENVPVDDSLRRFPNQGVPADYSIRSVDNSHLQVLNETVQPNPFEDDDIPDVPMQPTEHSLNNTLVNFDKDLSNKPAALNTSSQPSSVADTESDLSNVPHQVISVQDLQRTISGNSMISGVQANKTASPTLQHRPSEPQNASQMFRPQVILDSLRGKGSHQQPNHQMTGVNTSMQQRNPSPRNVQSQSILVDESGLDKSGLDESGLNMSRNHPQARSPTANTPAQDRAQERSRHLNQSRTSPTINGQRYSSPSPTPSKPPVLEHRVWGLAEKIVNHNISMWEGANMPEYKNFSYKAPIESRHLNSVAKTLKEQKQDKMYNILRHWKHFREKRTTTSPEPFNRLYYAMFETTSSTLLALKTAFLIYCKSTDLCLTEFGVAHRDLLKVRKAVEILEEIFNWSQQDYNKVGKYHDRYWNPSPHLCILMLASEQMKSILQPSGLECHSIQIENQKLATPELVLARYCWWMAGNQNDHIDCYREHFLKHVALDKFQFLLS